jgi:methyl acetate hydrolase
MAENDIDRPLRWPINTEGVPGRRSAGSLAWAGLFNTCCRLDPRMQVAGVLFAGATVLLLLDDFETAVYRTASGSVSHG